MDEEKKQRMIQEYVHGRQLNLTHIIANPQRDLTKKIGLSEKKTNARGILTITPGEAAIIAEDLATKSAEVEIGFVDRFTGSVVISGDVGSIEAAVNEVVSDFENVLRFSITQITRS